MPELPEVETICLMLRSKILQEKIFNVSVIRRDLRWPIQEDFEDICTNNKICDVFRRGKYIIIKLDHGYIIWHLGMSGSIKLKFEPELIKHDHVLLSLSNNKYLVYNDPRRFGSLFWSEDYKDHCRIKSLGLEPLSEDTTAEAIYKITCTKNKNIKDTIMDASYIVGVGNIYANEALFMSRINPKLAAKNLSYNKIAVLLDNIRIVLNKAIIAGGTTLNDYVNLDGKPGYFQQKLQVYGRAGEPCFSCGNILEKLSEFSRQTVFCSNCQK